MSELNDLEVIVPKGPLGESDTENRPLGDDLHWADQVLFEHADNVLTRSTNPIAQHSMASWTALPLRGPVRRLVPASAAYAAEAFANDHDAMSNRRRVLGRAARLSVRSGALRLAPKLSANADIVFADPTASVIAAAAHALGVPVAACAITLGPRRYNRKPVVQLMDAAAQTVGYLKVGASPLTSAMVATEAAAVGQLDATNPVLRIPNVLWRSQWHGRDVACFSPVALPASEVVAANADRLIEVAHAVIDAGGGRHHVAFRGCAPCATTRAIASPESTVHQLIDQAEAVFGDREISVGSWHGDFSPWNMISSAASTALIDWEFFSSSMPIGADLLHHRVMVATHLEGQAPWRPLRVLLDARNDVPELHALSVPTEQHRPHVLLYLFELMRRDLELQNANQPDTGFGVAARAAAEALLADAAR